MNVCMNLYTNNMYVCTCASMLKHQQMIKVQMQHQGICSKQGLQPNKPYKPSLPPSKFSLRFVLAFSSRATPHHLPPHYTLLFPHVTLASLLLLTLASLILLSSGTMVHTMPVCAEPIRVRSAISDQHGSNFQNCNLCNHASSRIMRTATCSIIAIVTNNSMTNHS